MDIHRCRFVQYPPQPINAVAFSHPSDPKKKTPAELRLAVGRNNGDVEIWNPLNGLWVQETTLKGTKNTTIEQLAWTQDLVVDEDANGAKVTKGPLRLFSTGGSTTITEWDLCTGAPKRRAEGNFGDIWCFAAQPQLKETAKNTDAIQTGAGYQLLAAGCSDGTIILFSTEDDELRYLRALVQPPVKKPKVLSLTWRDRNTVVAGYEDSTIRVVDLPAKRIIRNMSLGTPVDGNNSVVWSVKCLPDGSIVSGDSTGELKIWDPRNYALVQRVKGHKADILDIGMSAYGDTIFSLGVDRRTVTYKPATTQSGAQRTRWGEVAHKRYHQHDVKCATSFESSEISVLVSGGMDARLVVLPIRRAQSEYHRGLPHLPQRSQISASSASRLFMSWWDQEITVYHVRKYRSFAEENLDLEPGTEACYDTLAKIFIQGDDNIQDANISDDGQFIIAATSTSVKMFQLQSAVVSGRPTLRSRQVALPSSISRLGARRAGFSTDGKWLYTVRNDNTVALAKILPSQAANDSPSFHEKIVRLHRTSRSKNNSVLRNYRTTIAQICFSSDNRVMAVGDLSGAVDVWVLEGHEDLDYVEAASDQSDAESDSSSSNSSDDDDDDDVIIHGQRWIRNPSGSQLPQLDSSILALTFRPAADASASSATNGNLGLHATRHTPHPVSHELPSSDVRLIAVTATHQLVEFDVLNSKLSDWSRRNPSNYLPHDLTRIKDRVVGCFWDCTDLRAKGQRLWLYGSSWMFMLDLSRDLQSPPQNAVNGPPNGSENGRVEKVGTLGRYEVMEPKADHGLAKRPRLAIQDTGKSARKRKRNTGAGDEIRDHERPGGVGGHMQKYKDAATRGGDVEMVDLDGEAAAGMDHGEEDTDNDELALMRRGGGGASIEEASTDDPRPSGGSSISRPDARPAYFHTFNYKSILGIGVIGPPPAGHEGPTTVRVGQADGGDHDARPNVEVVIVERSVDDAAQAPRFDGGQDWEV